VSRISLPGDRSVGSAVPGRAQWRAFAETHLQPRRRRECGQERLVHQGVDTNALSTSRLTPLEGIRQPRLSILVARSLIVSGLACLALLLTPAELLGVVALRSDPTWQTNGSVRAVLYHDGVVYIGGMFTEVRPPNSSSGAVARKHLAAFDEATGALLPWNPSADRTVRSLSAAGSTIYLGGDFRTVGGKSRSRLAAVDAETGNVLSWNPRANASVLVVRVGPDGNVFTGGKFVTVKGQARHRVAAISPEGTLLAWDPNVTQVEGTCPPRCTPFVASLGLSADGLKVYIGGHFGMIGSTPRNNGGAASITDASVTAWNPDVFADFSPGANPNQLNAIHDIEVGLGHVYISGDWWAVDGRQRSANLASVDPRTGSLDHVFDANTDGNTKALRLHDDVLYIGGHYQNVGPRDAWIQIPGEKSTLTGPGAQVKNHIAALDPITGAILDWPVGVNSKHGVHDMDQSAGHLGVGGDFTRAGGRPQQGFAQFAGQLRV
jgi:hypothetical protein